MASSKQRGISVEIFCESGREMGLGHLYRCTKLARICAQIQAIATITLHNRGDYAPTMRKILGDDLHTKIHYRAHEWLDESFSISSSPVLAIIDSYTAPKQFYAHIQHQSSALICLDDTLRDIYPPKSYILSPTLESSAYFAKQPYYLWCGEQYAITPQIRKESPLLRQDSNKQASLPAHLQAHLQASLPTNAQRQHIFVNFGGADSRNLTQDFIDSLAHSTLLDSLHFHIVLGGGYTHTLCSPLLQAHHKHHKHIAIYRDLSPDAFLSLARQCSYAISAGGGSMLELLWLKLPSIIIESAPNQRAQIAHFVAKGAIQQAKDTQHALAILAHLLATPSHTQAVLSALKQLQLGTALEPALKDLAQALLIATH